MDVADFLTEFLIGALLAVGGGYLFRREWRLHRRGMRTDGCVVDYDARDESDGDGGTRTHYYPVLEFSAADGQMVRAVSEDGDLTPRTLTGAQVRILYDPANPGFAQIAGPLFRTAWWPALLGIIGLFVILASFAYV